MTEVVGWRAWFTEGRVFDSRECAWADVPLDGCLIAINYQSNGGRRLEDGRDYYWEKWGEILSNNDAPETIRFRYGSGVRVVRGIYVPTGEFHRVVKEALAKPW